MKIDPYCQRRYCSPLNVLFSGVTCKRWYRRAFLRNILFSPPHPCLTPHSGASAMGRQTRVGWRKQDVFELNTSISRKRKEIRPKLLSNEKIPWNSPNIRTYVQIFGEFHGISQIWEATTAKQMKILVLSANALNVLFGPYVTCVDLL